MCISRNNRPVVVRMHLEFFWISAWIAVTSVSSENVVGVSVMIPVVIPVMIPGSDFLVAELSGIEIVLESLKDCVGAVDTVRSLFSLISSCAAAV